MKMVITFDEAVELGLMMLLLLAMVYLIIKSNIKQWLKDRKRNKEGNTEE